MSIVGVREQLAEHRLKEVKESRENCIVGTFIICVFSRSVHLMK